MVSVVKTNSTNQIPVQFAQEQETPLKMAMKVELEQAINRGEGPGLKRLLDAFRFETVQSCLSKGDFDSAFRAALEISSESYAEDALQELLKGALAKDDFKNAFRISSKMDSKRTIDQALLAIAEKYTQLRDGEAPRSENLLELSKEVVRESSLEGRKVFYEKLTHYWDVTGNKELEEKGIDLLWDVRRDIQKRINVVTRVMNIALLTFSGCIALSLLAPSLTNNPPYIGTGMLTLGAYKIGQALGSS